MNSNSSVIALAAMLSVAGLAGMGACEGDSSLPNYGFGKGGGGNTNAAEADGSFRGFSWVREGSIAGMPKPGGYQPLDEDLSYLEAEGIDVLFSLTETPTSSEAAAAHGIELVHVPVKDFTAPTQPQLLAFLDQAQAAVDAGQSVGVHCLGGHGRTGTFLAAWFIHEGMSADEALAEIRRLRPGSVETSTQEQALHDLAAFLNAPDPGGPIGDPG